MKKHIIHYFYFIFIKMNIPHAHEIKKTMLTIKLIFHYQVG